MTSDIRAFWGKPAPFLFEKTRCSQSELDRSDLRTNASSMSSCPSGTCNDDIHLEIDRTLNSTPSKQHPRPSINLIQPLPWPQRRTPPRNPPPLPKSSPKAHPPHHQPQATHRNQSAKPPPQQKPAQTTHRTSSKTSTTNTSPKPLNAQNYWTHSWDF